MSCGPRAARVPSLSMELDRLRNASGSGKMEGKLGHKTPACGGILSSTGLTGGQEVEKGSEHSW